jgi:hypothetical protein
MKMKCIAAALIIGLSVTAVANDPAVSSADPDTALKKLKEGNARFAGGTVAVDSSWRLNFAFTDDAYNSSSTDFLHGLFDSAFQTFFFGPGNGTYTGNIFSIDVPAGTAPSLYAYQFMTSNPSLFQLQAAFQKDCVGDGCFTDGGPATFSASQAFSVQVTGVAVPESGESVLLFGASVIGICSPRRALLQFHSRPSYFTRALT